MERSYISDMHIADKSDKDDFRQENKLIEFLTDIPDNSLIIVGDGLELWQASYRDIYRKRKRLLNLLYDKTEYWVLGNHDAALWKYRRIIPTSVKMCEYLMLDDTLILHGHQFDIFNSKWKSVGKAATKATGWLEGKIHKDVDHWLSSLKSKITRTGKHGNDTAYAKNSIDLAKGMVIDSRQIKGVIIGHTHRQKRFEAKGVEYINCGTWTNGKHDITKVEQGLST